MERSSATRCRTRARTRSPSWAATWSAWGCTRATRPAATGTRSTGYRRTRAQSGRTRPRLGKNSARRWPAQRTRSPLCRCPTGWRSTRDRSPMRSGALPQAAAGTPRATPENAYRNQQADLIEANSNGGMADWNSALEGKRYYDDQINWQQKGGPNADQMQMGVDREIANGLRGGIKDSLEVAGQTGQVPRELADQ